ncbi:hypothetical protein Pse7367_2312 [Thalassoporum mexicanum PCC 7367]|nr:hypothetical protein Pse7367_2312 [Pseudanabaena sp. PCC 7367]
MIANYKSKANQLRLQLFYSILILHIYTHCLVPLRKYQLPAHKPHPSQVSHNKSRGGEASVHEYFDYRTNTLNRQPQFHR